MILNDAKMHCFNKIMTPQSANYLQSLFAIHLTTFQNCNDHKGTINTCIIFPIRTHPAQKDNFILGLKM